MAAPAGPPIDVGAITSSTLIGSLVTFFLFGTLVIQVYVYSACFPKDRPFIKYLVYSVFFAMALCMCFNAADAHFWFAANFGNLVAFGEPRLSAFTTPMMGSIIALVVQAFYCYRITIFRTSARWVVGLIGLASLLQAIGGIGGGAKAYIDNNETHDKARTVLVYMWLVGDAVADLLIAVTMTYILTKASEEQQTRRVVRGVVRLVIETNAFSASVAVVGLILFAGIPNTTYFVCPTMALPGIYANTLLVVLNNRALRAGASAKHAPLASNAGAPRTSGDMYFATSGSGGTTRVGGTSSHRPASLTLPVDVTSTLGPLVAAPNPNRHSDENSEFDPYVDSRSTGNDDGDAEEPLEPFEAAPRRLGRGAISWGSESTRRSIELVPNRRPKDKDLDDGNLKPGGGKWF